MYRVNILNKSGEREMFSVSEEVFTYIMALEFRIKHPSESKIHETYPERFPVPGEEKPFLPEDAKERIQGVRGYGVPE